MTDEDARYLRALYRLGGLTPYQKAWEEMYDALPALGDRHRFLLEIDDLFDEILEDARLDS